MMTAQNTPDSTDLAIRASLDRLKKSSDATDLDALVRGARRSLLLVDCSGSMESCIRSGARKIDALREVVSTLRATHPAPVAAFGTSNLVEVVDVIPEPQGSTPLAEAIEFGHAQGATHLVIVTDGCPNSESAAFNAARRFRNPIDVFYIGDGLDRWSQFAKELAAMTGGTCGLTDLGKPKELAGTIRLMLGDGSN